MARSRQRPSRDPIEELRQVHEILGEMPSFHRSALLATKDRLDETIADFEAERDSHKVNFREKHDALRELWLLANSERDIHLLRQRIEDASSDFMIEIDRNAELTIPRLFQQWRAVSERFGIRAERLNSDLARWAANPSFRAWAREADDSVLAAAISVSVADGARKVKGRSRGAGKEREKERLEPLIMGAARGGGQSKGSGPPNRLPEHLMFVGHLAEIWAEATQEFPENRRRRQFDDFVRRVFSWISPEERNPADYVLLHFWAGMSE